MTRTEKASILGLLLFGRSYSLAALAEAEAQGDERQAAMTRRNIEKADQALDIIEAELTATQNVN